MPATAAVPRPAEWSSCQRFRRRAEQRPTGAADQVFLL